jgi:hypothetical protein
MTTVGFLGSDAPQAATPPDEAAAGAARMSLAGGHSLPADPSVRTCELGVVQQMLDVLPACAYTCDAEGLITYYNRRAVDVWGRAPEVNEPVDRY